MEEQIVEVLKKEVICKLVTQNPETLPLPLLQGLLDLVETSKKPEMLSGLF